MVTNEDVVEGGCVCGAVRIAVRGRPLVIHGCHCRFCQQGSGSAFSVSLMLETAQVSVIRGATEPVSRQAALGVHIGHACPDCQTELFGHHPMLGTAIAFVGAGVLDKPGGYAPDVHCFTRTKYDWVVLPEGVPAFEADYDMAAVWSDEAKARLAALPGMEKLRRRQEAEAATGCGA
jgi:hypothetical protein